MGGWANIFIFLSIEDINAHKVDLSVTVLASLRSAHFNNFAWSTLKNYETVLTKSRALLGKDI